MHVTTITMSREAALAKLEAYEASRRTRGESEYAAALEGYRVLAEGTPLISLQQTIRNGGFDEKWRPRLAIARACREKVRVRWGPDQHHLAFDSRKDPSWWSDAYRQLVIQVDMGRDHEAIEARTMKKSWVEGYAMVPLVPPEVWAKAGEGVNPKDYHILWEVEKWMDIPKPLPDRDPYLLRHVHGDLWAVIAEWDLTELERLVMAERNNP